MQVKTILNRVEKHARFIFGHVSLVEGDEEEIIEVDIRPRRGSLPRCSKCERPGSCYDTRERRQFEYIPLWGIRVLFNYQPRRVNCRRCGVKVERMPWAAGKRRLTKTYSWYLAGWAKRLSWKEVATVFRTSWENVFRSVEMAVEWGLKNRDLESVKAIGVDELQWKHGQRYLTLVYQIDEGCRRLLWVGQERQAKTLAAFFDWFGETRTKSLRFICSDMWAPYLKVIAEMASGAVHVLDRFHIAANLNEAVDEVRRQDVRDLKSKGAEPILKGSRWIFLKRTGNLNLAQAFKLSDLLRTNLRTVRAYLLKQELDFLWTYTRPSWAGRFLDAWITKVMRSRLEPMKRKARTLRKHRALILNWFRAKGLISSGIVEGFNNKARVTTRRAYGYRTYRAQEVALYHTLADLPVPEIAHRFC